MADTTVGVWKLRSFSVLCKLSATTLATPYVSDPSRMQRLRQAARLEAIAKRLRRVRQTAFRDCRSCGVGKSAQSRKARDAREIALALSRIVAAAERWRAHFFGRRRNAAAAIGKVRPRGRCRSLDQRRVHQSDPKLQSARNERRRFDGEISRRRKTGRSERGKRRWRTGRLRRARRTRGAYLYAARHAAREHY